MADSSHAMILRHHTKTLPIFDIPPSDDGIGIRKGAGIEITQSYPVALSGSVSYALPQIRTSNRKRSSESKCELTF